MSGRCGAPCRCAEVEFAAMKFGGTFPAIVRVLVALPPATVRRWEVAVPVTAHTVLEFSSLPWCGGWFPFFDEEASFATHLRRLRIRTVAQGVLCPYRGQVHSHYTLPPP